jgi:hypothetical protein
MPRVPYADLEALPEDARKYLGARRSPQGNVFKMIANAGKATTGYLGLGAILRQNLAIDLLLYEYVIVRVANLSRTRHSCADRKYPRTSSWPCASGRTRRSSATPSAPRSGWLMRSCSMSALRKRPSPRRRNISARSS